MQQIFSWADIMCIFCEEIENPKIAKKLFGESFAYDNRIIYSDENILVIPGYGPQVYPYILVMTRRHTPSFLDITANEKRSFFDFFEILLDSGLYQGNSVCVFEHGGDPRNGCSSVTHCHLHVIEEKYGLFEKIDWKEDQKNITLTKSSRLVRHDNYLLIGKYEAGQFHMKLNTRPANEHQYFRKKLSHLLGVSEWDWRIGMNNERYVPKLIEEARRKIHC